MIFFTDFENSIFHKIHAAVASATAAAASISSRTAGYGTDQKCTSVRLKLSEQKC